jgi:hypothetical protein
LQSSGGSAAPATLRLTEEDKAILLRITMGPLADEFADSLAASSDPDPLRGGGPDDQDD